MHDSLDCHKHLTKSFTSVHAFDLYDVFASRDEVADFLREKLVPESDISRFCAELEQVTTDSEHDAVFMKKCLLSKLMSGDIHHKENNFYKNFAKFTMKVPEWSAVSNIPEEAMPVLFFNNPQYASFADQSQAFMVIRRQLLKFCFMHGPVVLLHYLIAINSKGANLEMVDLSKYEKDLLSGPALVAFLDNVGGKGGNSIDFFRNIAKNCKYDVFDSYMLTDPAKESFNVMCEEILALVANYPALVTGFMIDEAFYASSPVTGEKAVSHDVPGDPVEFQRVSQARGPHTERHCMVLIGGRRAFDTTFFSKTGMQESTL